LRETLCLIVVGGGRKNKVGKEKCFPLVCLEVGREKRKEKNIFDISFVWFPKGREIEGKICIFTLMPQ